MWCASLGFNPASPLSPLYSTFRLLLVLLNTMAFLAKVTDNDFKKFVQAPLNKVIRFCFYYLSHWSFCTSLRGARCKKSPLYLFQPNNTTLFVHATLSKIVCIYLNTNTSICFSFLSQDIDLPGDLQSEVQEICTSGIDKFGQKWEVRALFASCRIFDVCVSKVVACPLTRQYDFFFLT